MIGETVGEYRLLSPLGAWGAGEVYIGEHTDRGTKAAVELIAPPIMAQVAPVQKFLHVARTLGRLNADGALKIHDVGIDGQGRGYVIRELIDTDTLARRIESMGRLTVAQIGDIARQVAAVLAAAHDEGVVHGDLRPDVILLMPQDALRSDPVKVAEFGVAALKRAASVPVGPVYTAPELISGTGTPDWRVDAYSLGCVIFEMATGRPPFVGSSAEEVRTKHVEAPPPAARSIMPDVPPSLDLVLGRLLSKRPEDRYPSMRDVIRALEGFSGGSTRPLAPSAGGAPTRASGELGGEIVARPAAEPPPDDFDTPSIIAPAGSIIIDANELAAMQLAVPAIAASRASAPSLSPPPPPPAPPHGPRPETTASLPRHPSAGRSRLALWLVLVAVLLAGGTALALTLR